jgi:hypothetical protein
MAFEIPQDLHPDLMPLAWLLGRWEGRGHGDYPTIEKFEFGQQIDFSEDGKRERPLALETGFWRPKPNGKLEVVLAHPTGFAEIWYGEIDGAKIEMRTDVVARTETAKEVAAGHRLYGLVKGELMWAYDMAAEGLPLQPHLWATLVRV